MIDSSCSSKPDFDQMCAKSAHVPNLDTCEHARIRSAVDQTRLYFIGDALKISYSWPEQRC